jgi:hypothetical protein
VETEPEASEPPRIPTREFLLAQALDMCIEAERRSPGSAKAIISRQPAWARSELRELIALASALDATSRTAAISRDFRLTARERLMQHIGGAHEPARLTSISGHPSPRRRRRRWAWRGLAGGLLAAVLAVVATVSASASALPGEPLYRLKQAREDLGVRLAPDDESRALALLRQADARLNETTRLLDQGRVEQAAQTTQRYDDTIDRATAAYVVTLLGSDSDAQPSPRMQSQLDRQQRELKALLVNAPEPVRGVLRQALVETERSRALVANPHAVDRAINAEVPIQTTSVAAPAPTLEAESVPTLVPTTTPPVIVAQASSDEPHQSDVEPAASVKPDEETATARGAPAPRAVQAAPAARAHTDRSGSLARDSRGEAPAGPTDIGEDVHEEDSATPAAALAHTENAEPAVQSEPAASSEGVGHAQTRTAEDPKPAQGASAVSGGNNSAGARTEHGQAAQAKDTGDTDAGSAATQLGSQTSSSRGQAARAQDTGETDGRSAASQSASPISSPHGQAAQARDATDTDAGSAASQSASSTSSSRGQAQSTSGQGSASSDHRASANPASSKGSESGSRGNGSSRSNGR